MCACTHQIFNEFVENVKGRHTNNNKKKNMEGNTQEKAMPLESYSVDSFFREKSTHEHSTSIVFTERYIQKMLYIVKSALDTACALKYTHKYHRINGYPLYGAKGWWWCCHCHWCYCCCCCCCYCCRHCAARQMESTLHLQHTFHSIHRFQRDNYVLLCSPHKNTLFFRAYQSTASTIYHLLCFLVGKNVIVSMV